MTLTPGFRWLAIVTALASTVACDAILGLDAKPVAPMADAAADAGGSDARSKPDARRDAREAAPKPMAAVAVSSGYAVADWCVLVEDGSVWCWGDNESRQLGEGCAKTWCTKPVQIEHLPPAIAVSVGAFTTCALAKDGGVWCWGYGFDGELGDGGKTVMRAKPGQPKGLESGVMAVVAGYGPICAIKDDGSAWCWGLGVYGQIGNGSIEDALVPVEVVGLTSGVTSIGVGGDTTCAVKDGGVRCWGSPSGWGELGNGTTTGSLVPVAVPSLASGVTAVSVGLSSECALTGVGEVKCWGYGQFGELGDDIVGNSDIPVEVQGLSGAKQISVGYNIACALLGDGSVDCWGEDDQGQLGTGKPTAGADVYYRPVAGAVPGISSAIAVSSGDAPCVVTAEGSVECWGGTDEVALTPIDVRSDTAKGGAPTSVVIGGHLSTEAFACQVTTMNLVECWGGNDEGQLDDGSFMERNVPVYSPVLPFASAVAAGPAANFACAVVSGLVYCWGDNGAGQLGNDSKKESPNPLPISGLSGVVSVAVGREAACALTTSGAVLCWGDNTYGELGNDSFASSSKPVQVQGLSSGVVAISVGIDDACAVLAAGTIECWGNNQNGELGNGTQNLTQVPVPVSGITNAVGVSMGWFSGCAVTAAGKVECWGDNMAGELGNGGTVSSSVPVVVHGISSGATAVSVGQGSACAIVSGGARCWGSSFLGDGTSLSNPTPVQVSGLETQVTAIAVGANAACAVVAGKSVCWGSNSAGQLGAGLPPDELQPTPVPGFP
jgi:alpha-tubulin suppressor-like RCC1 family protein